MRPRTVYLTLLIALTLATVNFPVGQRELLFHLEATPPAPQRLKVLGYDRDHFGPGWAMHPSGCTTREEILASTFDAPGCAPTEPTTTPQPKVRVIDPYTGHELTADDVEIDHVFPLSAAWDLGAHSWDDPTRLRFANDPANLIATSSVANREKSDQLPSEWIPPLRSARCAYATRLAAVAHEYRLALPQADRKAMRAQCRKNLIGLLSVD